MDNTEVQYLYNILNAVLGKDNELRKQCEVQLEELKTGEPNKLCIYLLKILQESPDLSVRSLCCVLLRRYFSALSDAKENLWSVITPENKETIKTQLLNSLDVERERTVLHAIGEVIAEITGSMIDIEQKEWADLKTKIFHQMISAQNKDDKIVEAGIRILNTIFPYVADDIIEAEGGIDTLLEVFSRTLQHPTLDIKVTSLQALGSLLEVIESGSTKLFKQLIPLMVAVPVHAAEADEETEVESSLVCLIEVTEVEPKFFKDHFSQIFEAMLKVFSKTDYTNELIRHQPVEFMVSLAERITSVAEKQPQGIKLLTEMIFKLMVDIDEDVSQKWMSPPDGYIEEEDDDDSGDSVGFGKGCVDRLISSLGEEMMLPILSELVMTSLGNEQDWRYKNAALMALSQIGEFIDDINKIANLVPIIIQHLGHAHPKIRYAALHCLGQLSEDKNPEFQENYQEQLLPVLLQPLSDPVPRVQAHASAAVTNFFEGCEPEVSKSAIPQYIPKLFELVHNGVSLVKENAMTATASIAESCGELFAEHYDDAIPALFQILVGAQNKVFKQFRGQTIECITLIAAAVGKDKFIQHAPQVIQAMLEIQETSLDSKDPQRNYLLSAWQRICLVMKDDFAPYLKQILPSIMKQANLTPEMSIAGSPDKKSDLTEILKEVQGTKGGETIHKFSNVHTWETEEKEVGINMLIVFIDELKGLYYEYINPTTQIILPLVGYSANDEIRKSAASALPGLVRCAKAANAPQHDLVEMAKLYLQTIFKALSTEIDTETETVQISALKEVFEELNCQFMDASSFNSLCDELFKLLKKSNDKKNQQETLKLCDELEEEEREIAKVDIETEEEFQMGVAELFGMLFKTHKELSMPLLNVIYNELLPEYMKETATKMQHKFGVFILVDMVEFLGVDVVGNIFPQIAEGIMKFAADKDTSVRQASCYGIGMLAKFGYTCFPAVSNNALQALFTAAAIPMPSNPSLEAKKRWGYAKDNAVSSIGKIIKHQTSSLGDQFANVTTEWIKLLPLGFDKDEAKEQHEFLIDILLQNEQMVYGASYENVSGVVHMLANIIGTKYVNHETNVKAKEVFMKLREKVGAALDQIWVTLEAQKQERLRKTLEA